MKTKHEKIVEILKDADDNGHLFSDTAATILEQLEPEGEVKIEDFKIKIRELDRESGYELNDVQIRWAYSAAKSMFSPPPQQPSEGEISDIFLNNTVDYYGTAYMIFDGFKAAIKELNR